MEKKKIFFVSDEQITDLVIPIPNLVLIIPKTGRPRTPLLCPSVLVRLRFKFFILTFCPSLTTANSGLQKRQGAKNRFWPTYSARHLNPTKSNSNGNLTDLVFRFFHGFLLISTVLTSKFLHFFVVGSRGKS